MKFWQDAQRRTDILGLGKPFATRWNLALLLGLLAFGAYRLTLPVIVSMFSLHTQFHYWVLVYCGPSTLLLLAMFVAHKRWCFPDIRFVGDVRAGLVSRGILAVTVIYLIAYGIALWLGQPREPTMAMLYFSKTPTQIAVMLVSLLILPPIMEELAFRHFLLSVLPFEKNKRIACVTIVGTAAFFSFQHTGYVYPTTFVSLFALGVVFALARIRSNGLVLPIGLHAYAIAFALACDQVVKHLQAQ